MDSAELAARIREKRLARQLSVRQAASEAGVSPATFSRVERGDHLPDRENLIQLAQWASIPLEQLTSTPVESSATDRGTIVHQPGESTPEAVALHLRADKDLTPEDAHVLMEVFRVAYENLRKRHE